MDGFDRPWRFGVLHRGNSRLLARVLAPSARASSARLVGDNQPYAMDGTDYTVPHHAAGRGLDYLELEVRQDLIADEPAGSVSERLAPLTSRTSWAAT